MTSLRREEKVTQGSRSCRKDKLFPLCVLYKARLADLSSVIRANLRDEYLCARSSRRDVYARAISRVTCKLFIPNSIFIRACRLVNP